MFPLSQPKGVTSSVKSFLKILYTLLIVGTAVSLFSIPVSAAVTPIASYAQAGYTGSETDVFAPEPEDGIRRLDMTAPWDFLGDAMHVKRHIRNGSCTAYAILDTDECDGVTTFTLEMADDLSDYRVLCFGIGFTTKFASPSPIGVELELTDSDGNCAVSQTELQIPEGEFDQQSIWWNLLCFDISGFEGRGDTEQLTITLTYDPSAPPNVLRLTNPYVQTENTDGFAFVDRYLTNSLTGEAGTFAIRSGAARPDDRGQLELNGSFVLAEQPLLGSQAFLEIGLSRIQSGSLTVGIEYENEDLYVTKINLAAGAGTDSGSYAVPVDMADRLKSFTLTFDSIVCDVYFKLDSIRLHSENYLEVEGNPDLGRVTSLKRTGTSVVFSGEMKRDAVKKYGDAALHFYAIPGWTSNDLSTAVEIGQAKLSTRFDYTADLSAYPYLADTYRFFAALVTDTDGLLPLSAPVYPHASDLPEQLVSNMGLYDAAEVGVFESNVSHVIVEVPLDRLLTGPQAQDADTSAVLSYTVYRSERAEDGGNVFGTRLEQVPMSLTFLRELDSEINFYISAGLEVYLRLTSESMIPGLTYEEPGAQAYAVSPRTPEARTCYTAAIRYLCRRYDGISGLILGDAVNLGQLTGGGADDRNAAVYAHELAELCRIAYHTAASEIEDILIVLPFRAVPDASEDTGGFRSIDPKTLTVLMSSCLEGMGTVPWAMMYCTDSLTEILGVEFLSGDALSAEAKFSDTPGAARRIDQLTDELAVDGCAAVMYYYEPSYETTLLGFRNTPELDSYSEYLAEMLAKLCGSTRARAVFLSLERLNSHLDHEFYSYLKHAESSPETVSGRRSVADFAALPISAAADQLARTVSQTAVWDFTNSFHPLGWIAGGGVSSCLTVYSDLFSEPDAERYARVLRSAVSSEENSDIFAQTGMAAGISLRNLSRTVDLSEVDYLEFTFAMNHPGFVMGDGHESGKVVFLIGSDDRRAEFKVSEAVPEQVLTYVCDLTKYEHRDQVDFMGIMVYADHDVYLDLSSVRAYSNTLTPAELADVFAASPAADEVPVNYEMIVVVSVIVFLFSVSAAVLLIRHDVEERREQRERQRQLAEKRSHYQRIRR